VFEQQHTRNRQASTQNHKSNERLNSALCHSVPTGFTAFGQSRVGDGPGAAPGVDPAPVQRVGVAPLAMLRAPGWERDAAPLREKERPVPRTRARDARCSCPCKQHLPRGCRVGGPIRP
jgi:hypothetical protein